MATVLSTAADIHTITRCRKLLLLECFFVHSNAKYTRFVPPFAFTESMELHRVSLRFKFMIVRLVAEGDAFALELLQPLTVDLNADGSRDRRVVPEDVAHVVEQRSRCRYPLSVSASRYP